MIENKKKDEVYCEKKCNQKNLTIEIQTYSSKIMKNVIYKNIKELLTFLKFLLKISKKVLHAKRMLKDVLEFNCRRVGMRTY